MDAERRRCSHRPVSTTNIKKNPSAASRRVLAFCVQVPKSRLLVALTASAFMVIHHVMRYIRQIIGEGKCGSPLAVFVGVLMGLQALLGGFGSAAMAQAVADPTVICSSHEDHHEGHKDPAGSHGADCCLTACRIAASLHAGLPASSTASALWVPLSVGERLVGADQRAPTRFPSYAGDARGPPAFSA
jgi:hypothetical protein